MKRSIWTATQFGLLGGLLIGSLISPAAAQEDPVGVVRITRPTAQYVKLASTIDDAPGMSEEFTDKLIKSLHQPGTRPAVLSAPTSPSASTTPSVPVHPISYAGEQPSATMTTDGHISYSGQVSDCNCKQCRKERRAFEKACKDAFKDCDGSGRYRGGYSSHDYFLSKFGFLFTSGPGNPWVGTYKRVYPEDVNYYDQRDSQLYSAQGYGVPMAVPLAPVVGHTYNLGWGVPSSRLTPISHVAR